MTAARGRFRRPGLAGRLLVAMALVVVIGGLTAWLVVVAIGPGIFHRHMLAAGLDKDAAAVLHAEEAFRSASTTSLGLALGAAALTSLAVSLFLTRRIGRSLGALSTAAARVAGGRFDSRVPAPGIGTEFDNLAVAFNDMAARLEDSHALRRRLLADVAHELRTPVATITAYLEGVEDGVASLTPDTIAVLRAQGSRLSRLADDLAAVTRAESRDLALHPEPTAPAGLLTVAARSAAGRFAARDVRLVVDVDDGLPDVVVDRDRIGQVLGNLLDNALLHTPAGGIVRVGAARADDGGLRLTVADTGDGIDAAHLPHVFERFYRVDTARDWRLGGSGIGLAIAKALVEAHGGTISADSDGAGRGATFAVGLPERGPTA
ncbi:sensor histidine kinase [Promicromonospora sp. NPDC050880]|uniref:sensor histidine kinase n=1 Tax=Promicromonospora sp. NPDC050880 TaxID=3364406 RepID=UPI00379468D5